MMITASLGLSGCSLLFVAKGGTRMGKGKEAPAPAADDLTQQINKPNIVTFKTRPEETFGTVSELFFGDSDQAAAIAKWNHLSPRKKLKPGTKLKIQNPDQSPNLAKLPPVAKTAPPPPVPSVKGRADSPGFHYLDSPGDGQSRLRPGGKVEVRGPGPFHAGGVCDPGC
jgi:hypothetical protein